MAGSGNVVRFGATFNTKDVDAGIKRINDGMSGMSKKAAIASTAIGVGIERAVSFGVQKLASVFPTVIQAASDLNETQSKVKVVFGESADAVLRFGKSAATALGLSENDAEAAAATFGNLFTAMGLAEGKSADMSLKLVTLAGDLASFNNLDPTEVLEKLRAGLTGESEPLKSLGININETILKTEALEQGFISAGASTAELTLLHQNLDAATAKVAATVKKYGADSAEAVKATVAQEAAQQKLEDATSKFPGTLDAATKAQAAYSLIFKQTTKAQGDFTRTSGGLANQQRILRAAFQNTAATIGTALLPKVTEVVQKVNALIQDHQPEIAAFAASLPGVFDKLVSIIGRIPWDAVKTAFEAMGTGAKAAFDVFNSAPEWLQAAVLTGWGLNKLTGGALGSVISQLGSGLIKGVLGMNAGVVNINAATVNGGGVGIGAAGGARSLLPALGLAGLIVGVATEVVGPAVRRWALDNGLAGSGSNAGKSESQLAWERNHPNGAVPVDVQNFPQSSPAPDRNDPVTAAVVKTAESMSAINDAANAARDDVHAQLKGTLDSTKAIEDGNALVKVYSTGTAAFQRGATHANDWVARNIEILKGLQQKFAQSGDTKTAAALGSDIDQLRLYLGTKLDAIPTAIDGLTPTVNNFTGFVTGGTSTGSGSPTINPYTGFAFQDGYVGAFDRPTHAIFGEAGKEAVAILKNPRRGLLPAPAMAGPVNVYISIDSRHVTKRQRAGSVWNTLATR